MAKGFKCGSGGGVPLNFKVVGGTSAPSNPKENTIWINTDAEITSWVFSATQPETATEGMAWIYTGSVSPQGFNALKKNCIMIYPLATKQYVNGAWVEKVAKIYQNGVWADWWNGELYTAGNEWISITGSWYGKPWAVSSGAGAASNATVEKNDTYIKMSLNATQKGGVLLTTKKIDLTDFSTLTFNGCINQNGFDTSVSEKDANGRLYIFENLTGAYYDSSHVKRSDPIADRGAAGVTTLDVSALHGEYYIGVGLYTFNATNAYLVMNSMVLS